MRPLPGNSLQLDSPDVLGLQALRPFYDVELDRLAFLEANEILRS